MHVTWSDGVAAGHGWLANGAVAVEAPQQPVEDLLDDDGGDVKQAVHAAAAQDDEEEVP